MTERREHAKLRLIVQFLISQVLPRVVTVTPRLKDAFGVERDAFGTVLAGDSV